MVEPNPGAVEDPKVDPQTPASGTEPLSQNKSDTPIEPAKEPEVPVEPSKEPAEPAEPPKEPPTEPPKINVQARIDRMYARLQKERDLRAKAENENKALKLSRGEETSEPEERPPLTEADVRNIVAAEERGKRFKSVEAGVFERHPNALNEDGSFNMSDPFMKKYLEIGMRNPMLAGMEDGPILAESQAERELGTGYLQGKRDEAKRAINASNAHTLSSGTKPPPTPKGTLTAEEKHVAAKMGMTEQEYLAYKRKK